MVRKFPFEKIGKEIKIDKDLFGTDITLSKDDFNALMILAKEGIKTIDISYNAKCAYEILLKKLKGEKK